MYWVQKTLTILKDKQNDIRPMYASEHIDNRVFYIPFAYYYQVRLGTVPKLLGWMMIYVLPTAYYTTLPAWGYALMFVSLFSIYELGYILNDTEAIAHETCPSIRLYEHNMAYYRTHRRSIIAMRVVMGLPFIPVLLLFLLYNHVRNPKVTPLIYPLLVSSRYIPFVVYHFEPLTLLLLLLSFPLPNAIERFSMPRYRAPIIRTILPSESAKTYFRAGYYLLLTGTLLELGLTHLTILPIIILALYRCALCVVVQNYQPKNYLNG